MPNTIQPKPKENTLPYVWDLVKQDINERDETGANKYGTRLQPNNGRDVLKDAYQEALDLVVYLRQAIYERDSHPIHKCYGDYPKGLTLCGRCNDRHNCMIAAKLEFNIGMGEK